MKVSTRMKAIGALILTGILGGIAPLLMKVALTEFDSYQILFIRFGLATVFILPLLFSSLKKMPFKKSILVIPSGLLFTGNVFFMVVGIQFTTSIVSQLFYLLTPVIVSLVGYFLFKERISNRRILSMTICFAGSAFLILRSVQGGALANSIGTLKGNILILCAVLSWSFYVIYTKRMSQKFEPTVFLVSNFVIALLVSLVSFLFMNISAVSTVVQFARSSMPVMASLVTLAVVNSVLFFFMYQWSLKHVSAFIVASTTYLSPLSAALFAIPFFGEKLSMTLVLSAFSIFLGSYLILTEKK